MTKIVTVIGARPQFVKAAVVSRALAEHAGRVREVLVHTGQHYDPGMSEVFFEEMRIPRPDYNLGINGLSHGAMTGRMLEETERVLLREKPDWVLVYGDTNSTFAGALAARKLGIRVAHVEAGLRSFNRAMPEETNRILTDRISDLLFCPTETAVANLEREGFGGFPCRIVRSGDVMQDAALFYAGIARKPQGADLPDRFVLSTVHRAENTDDPEVLRSVFRALEAVAREVPVVMPLHPRTRGKLEAAGYGLDGSAVRFIPPVGYLEMVWLLQRTELVMTDSGGLQKEAYFFEKPCVTLRNETEWVELVEGGFNRIGGNRCESILTAWREMEAEARSGRLRFGGRLYGEGKAGRCVADALLEASVRPVSPQPCPAL